MEEGAEPFTDQVFLSGLRDLPATDVDKKFANLLDIKDYEESLRSGIVLDYYVSAYLFYQNNDFSDEDIARLLDLHRSLLEKIAAGISLKESMQFFRQYLSDQAQENRSDTNNQFLNASTVKCIVDYVSSTIFTHYNLYKYAFHEDQELQVLQCETLVCLAPPANTPFPPPLHEAISLEWYEKYMCPQESVPDEPSALALNLPSEHSTHGGEEKVSAPVQPSAEEILSTLKLEDIQRIVMGEATKTLQSTQQEMEEFIHGKELSALKLAGK
jgi:hypothetical protein